MDITNFNGSIRLGQWPASIDVSKMQNYHTNYGVTFMVPTCQHEDAQNGVLIYQEDRKSGLVFGYSYLWKEQRLLIQEEAAEAGWRLVFDSEAGQ